MRLAWRWTTQADYMLGERYIHPIYARSSNKFSGCYSYFRLINVFKTAFRCHPHPSLHQQNFDRQLGLYLKTPQQMHIKNAMIEDLSFVPRVIPLSLSCPVIKIACGSKFAVAITKVFHLTF
jgi:hypothetical protein